MVEGTDTGWMVALEKNGLGPSTEILEDYGIDSETDLLVLDQDDFSKLASRGLKPLYGKKLERWCGAVRERAENMLPNIQGATRISSESLNVVTECESGAENESERDGPERTTMTQTMTWRSWVKSQVLRTVQALHQQGPKRRPKRPRSR